MDLRRVLSERTSQREHYISGMDLRRVLSECTSQREHYISGMDLRRVLSECTSKREHYISGMDLRRVLSERTSKREHYISGMDLRRVMSERTSQRRSPHIRSPTGSTKVAPKLPSELHPHPHISSTGSTPNLYITRVKHELHLMRHLYDSFWRVLL